MDEIDKAMFYIFVLSLILIAVAYYAGSTSVLNSIGKNLATIILDATGRTSSGQFARYPQ